MSKCGPNFYYRFGSALSKACKHDIDSDAIHLARTANIVKKDMLKIKN